MDADPETSQPALLPEDYYMEGFSIVFTAAYHLKRGYCCGSGCRHCPYKAGPPNEEKAPSAIQPEEIS